MHEMIRKYGILFDSGNNIKKEIIMGGDPKKLIVNNKNDLLELLSLIIELSEKHFYRYDIYYKQLSEVVKLRIGSVKVQNKIDKDYIEYLQKDKIDIDVTRTMNYLEYKQIEDMISNVQLYLLNLFGDRTSKGGVSFQRYRKEYERLKKVDDSLPILDELTDEFRRLSNMMYTERNYKHHMTDAKFIEWIAYRRAQSRMGNYQKWPDREIQVDICEELSIVYLYRLFQEHTFFYYYSKIMLRQMRKDYSKIYGETMRITRKYKKEVDLSSIPISINGHERHYGKRLNTY